MQVVGLMRTRLDGLGRGFTIRQVRQGWYHWNTVLVWLVPLQVAGSSHELLWSLTKNPRIDQPGLMTLAKCTIGVWTLCNRPERGVCPGDIAAVSSIYFLGCKWVCFPLMFDPLMFDPFLSRGRPSNSLLWWHYRLVEGLDKKLIIQCVHAHPWVNQILRSINS